MRWSASGTQSGMAPRFACLQQSAQVARRAFPPAATIRPRNAHPRRISTGTAVLPTRPRRQCCKSPAATPVLFHVCVQPVVSTVSPVHTIILPNAHDFLSPSPPQCNQPPNSIHNLYHSHPNSNFNSNECPFAYPLNFNYVGSARGNRDHMVYRIAQECARGRC
jgi:hypothetical protein